MPRGPFFTHRPSGLGGSFFGGDARETLQREMNRVFDEIWRNLPTGGGDEAAAAPTRPLSVDVTETATEVRVTADLPGVAEHDVDVTLDDDRLTIRAERRAERGGGSETVHVTERAVGVSQRTITLPVPVDPEQVEASFDRGVLTVTLSKPRAAAGRKIPVRGAGASTGASTGASPSSGASTGAASPSGEAEPGFIQGDGALGASPSTGAGAEPVTDTENAAKPGGAVHGYNE